MRLTAKRIARLRKRIGRHPDGHGLYLQIASAGAASWLFRYEVAGRERMLGLGPLHTVSLKEARERAKAARLQLLDGVDPLEARKAARATRALEAAKAVTFREAAEGYLVAHEGKWRSGKHREQWRTTPTRLSVGCRSRQSTAAWCCARLSRSGGRSPKRPPGCAAASRRFWITPRCATCAAAKTPRAGRGTLNTSCRGDPPSRSSITPRCLTPTCLRSWPSYSGATVLRRARSNLRS